MDKIDYIVEIIKDNWSQSEIVDAWNQRCESHNYYDDQINYMGFFNELFFGLTPLEIVEKVKNSQFCAGNDYFAFNGYGNLVSFDEAEDYNSFSYEELAEYLVENGDSTTKEIDTDLLLLAFLDEHFISYDRNLMFDAISKYMEEETFDVLMDDWDDLADVAENIRIENEINS